MDALTKLIALVRDPDPARAAAAERIVFGDIEIPRVELLEPQEVQRLWRRLATPAPRRPLLPAFALPLGAQYGAQADLLTTGSVTWKLKPHRVDHMPSPDNAGGGGSRGRDDHGGAALWVRPL